MQDGAIIQIGTPEELVTAPATAYVAEFTREIPRAKVLSVRAVMTPAADGDGFAGEVAADDQDRGDRAAGDRCRAAVRGHRRAGRA